MAAISSWSAVRLEELLEDDKELLMLVELTLEVVAVDAPAEAASVTLASLV